MTTVEQYFPALTIYLLVLGTVRPRKSYCYLPWPSVVLSAVEPADNADRSRGASESVRFPVANNRPRFGCVEKQNREIRFRKILFLAATKE